MRINQNIKNFLKLGLIVLLFSYFLSSYTNHLEAANCPNDGGAPCWDDGSGYDRYTGGDSCTPKCNKTCTPTCGLYPGTSFTYSGPLCDAGRSRCTYSNRCGGTCKVYGANCYYPETNSQSNIPSGWSPSSTSMVIGNRVYQLSTDPLSPTKIDITEILNILPSVQDSNKTYKTNNVAEARSNVAGTQGRIPLGTTASSVGDSSHVRSASVIIDDGIYKMWYAGSNGNFRMYYAESTDGLTWNKYNNNAEARNNTTGTNGRLPLGTATSGVGDRVGVYAPSVVKDGNTYKMWYTGDDGSSVPRIYLATSFDGLTWSKVDNRAPVRDDSTAGRIALGANVAGIGDKNMVADPSVIKDGSTYKMWYAGHDGSSWRIYYATSSDGLTWNKVNNNIPDNSNTISSGGRIPLGVTGSGDDAHVRAPIVIKDMDFYRMWYSGYDGSSWRIYYATSVDGLTWIKENNAVPAATNTESTDGRIPRGTSGGDTSHILYSAAVLTNDGVAMYYSGSSGTWRIYRAEIKDDYPIKVFMPTTGILTGARNVLYGFEVNSYTPVLGSDSYNFDCGRAEDFCSISVNNVQRFLPNSLSIQDVFTKGSSGNVVGSYHSLNLCDDNTIKSESVNGYYVVNNKPEVEQYCPMDPSISINDPRCVPCIIDGELINANITSEDENCNIDSEVEECLWNQSLNSNDPGCIPPVNCDLNDPECAKSVFLSEVGSDMTAEGCKSVEFTGKMINNPLNVKVSAVDEDGNDEIGGVIVAFTKGSLFPTTVADFTSDYTYSDINNLAILITKDGDDIGWKKDPLVYGLTHDGKWGLLDEESRGLRTESGGDITLTILPDVEVMMRGNDEGVVTFKLILNFNGDGNSKPDGIYNFSTGVLDRYMLDGLVDQSSVERFFDWGIDLEDPIIERAMQEISGPTQVYLNLQMDGTGSNMTDYVLSGYRDGGVLTSQISLLNPVGYDDISLRTGDDYPKGCLPGVLGDSGCEEDTWHFPIPLANRAEDYTTDPNSILVDINQNEDGAVVMYTTAYDQGCNFSLRDHVLDLRPWVATKGGVIYSNGNAGSTAKSFAEEDNPAAFFDTGSGSTLKNYLITQILNEMTTGTELISSRNEAINDLVHSDAIKAVRADRIYDSNEKKNYWFDYFKKKLNIQLLSQNGTLKEFIVIGDRVTSAEKCDSGDSCVMYSTDSIEVPQNYICDTKTLIMSEKDIIITPGVTYEGSGIEGCIFLARNRIYVKEGEHLSTGGIVRYDYIDGFLVSEDQILIEQTLDINQPIRDGLEVRGGLVAFGRDSTDSTALLIQRNLRLYSYINPTLVVTWDVRYAKLSEIFFGSEAAMYKQEVGFKAF